MVPDWKPPAAAMSSGLVAPEGQHAAPSNAQLLSSILLDIGASDYLQKFIDDEQDDLYIPTYRNPDKISRNYGLPPSLASEFVEKCRARAGALRAGDLSSAPLSSSVPPPQPGAASAPVDADSAMREMKLEMVRELGKGGFGTVFLCKNPADKLHVAVKLVNDPKHAKEAMREGQRLRRAKHKNIVLMHRVHDLGNGSCALEMEAVLGGDLSRHIEAARRRPELRLPRDAVLRFSRQLLEALVYLHDTMKWLHGDIKPHNILMQCSPLPADGSAVDYSSAEIKLADFGLAKVMEQDHSTASFMLSNASTKAGVVKGTMWYLSPEALQGAAGGYDRTYTDDLWSACLVILEMDTGLTLQQLMTAPGAVKLDLLMTKTSGELLPLQCAVLAAPDTVSRCSSSAGELLRKLDVSMDPLFIWQRYDDAAQAYVHVHPAASFVMEQAFAAHSPAAYLSLQPPLDLNLDIQSLLDSPTALGSQTERKTGKKCSIRRMLKPSALTSSADIPIWQQLVDGKEWIQCGPSLSAKLDIDAKNPSSVIDAAVYRHVMLESSSIGRVQLPHSMNSEPYLTPAAADDIAILSNRVHDSLPEWDITDAVQVVNPTLASKYAAYRHRVAARCNGNPNERTAFHFASPFVMKKIWQEGEGHDPRLSNWAEVGKGSYFSNHVMYGYAYKYFLWPSSPAYVVKSEPPVGETMQVFATLVCLGNVADVGPGCETCPSPAWDAWKKEFEYQKSNENPSPKPTRPPVMPLPSVASERQHVLDLMHVKDAPRYDSVASTEGDLASHPASTNKDSAGARMCDVMHPRLRERAKEWAAQFILFDTAASYPMFIITLTKTRDSPMGLRQLMDAGCDAARIKTLGFTASDVVASGTSVQDMRAAGWTLVDLKAAGVDASSLIAAGYSFSELKGAGFTASQMKEAGCSAQQMREAHFGAEELKAAGYDISSLPVDSADELAVQTGQIWPKSAERCLRETVETLDEVLMFGAVQNYFDSPDERRIVFARLSQKIRNFQQAFGPDSENWTSVSQYSSLFSKAKIPFMLELLSETAPQSILRQPTRRVKDELIPFHKSLKTILKNMFPINMPLLAELMQNSSAASVSMSGKTVSLLIGSSQAGKSTTLNFLAGAALKAVECAGRDDFRLLQIPRTLPTDTARALEQITIGSGYRSETMHVRLLPIHHKGVDHYFCEAPGFGDDRGPEMAIFNGIGVVSALKKSDGVKIILLLSGAQIDLICGGFQEVFKIVAEIVANGLDEALPKLVYLFNNGGDRDFHGLLSDMFSEHEPGNFELKKIFTDAICKTCSKECAFLKEVRSDNRDPISGAHTGEWRRLSDSSHRYECSIPGQEDGALCSHGGIIESDHWSCCGELEEKAPCPGPLSKYASSHSIIAKYCCAPVSAKFDASEVYEAEYTRSVFAKQKISKLTRDDLIIGFKSNFRNSFLEHVGQQELAIDPKCLRFVCSDKSIDILHDSLIQLWVQLEHLCSLNNFRPDIVESKIELLVSLGASNLFHENLPTKPGVDILQDYKNVLQKIITITETSAQEFLDFVQKIIKISQTSAPDTFSQEFIDFVDETPSLSADALCNAILSFWRLVQLSNSHRIVTEAEGFPQLELKCMNLLPVSDLFNLWVDFQDSLGKQFLDALDMSISNQTAFPSERFQSLVLSMCTVSDLGTIGRKNFKNVSSKLLNTGESISSILKKKYTQTMSLIFNKYDALCRETSSMFNECAKSVVHFLNEKLCSDYFENLNRIRIFADLLMTLCPPQKVQHDIQLSFDGTGPEFNEYWVSSRQKTAHRALFEILASFRASLTSSVDDMLCRQSSFEQVLDCFENSVLVPLSNFQFILDSAKSHFSSWDHFDQAIVLRHESVESVFAYIRMMERCRSVILNSSQSAASIFDIKTHIFHSIGIPVAQQRLFFEQKDLSDDGNLLQYNVPHGGILHLSLYHTSHADVDAQEASSIMPNAARNTGNAETQIRLPDLLFPNARQFKISQESRGLVDLFKYWVFFLELITRCRRINDASSSEFVKETHRKIRSFLEKMCDHVEQFIGKLELHHDCKYDEAEWDCFSQYMVHLSDFADAFCNASLSSKNIFQKECVLFTKLSQNCHTTVKSLSEKLADDSEELAQMDSKLAPLKIMKRKCSSLFVACDELLNLLQCADKIQLGYTLRSESSANSRRFVNSMVQFIEPLSFHCQDKQEAVDNKFDWLYYLQRQCDLGERSTQEIFYEIAEKVLSVRKQCLIDWRQFLADCSLTLQENSSTMERFIKEDFHSSVQQSQEHHMQTWGDLRTHVSCVVGVLLKQQPKPHLPIYFNLAKFKNLQSHPVLFTSKFTLIGLDNAALAAEFNQMKGMPVSRLLEETMNLMRRLDALFSKLKSFCADDVVVADMQLRYQTLSDLLHMCRECSGMDVVWSESGFQRGESPTFFADQFSWLQGQLFSQKLKIELRHSASVKNLQVQTLLDEWPGLSPHARQALQVDIANKLKESAQELQLLFESIFEKKNEHSPLYRNCLPQDIDFNQVIRAVGSWAPVVFADHDKLQDDLFEKFNLCYDALQKGTQFSVNMCKQALSRYDFQHAEEHFKVVNDGRMIVDESLKALKSVKDSEINVRLQKAAKYIESLAEWCRHHVTDLHSEFDLASKTVLKIYDCKSAVIKGPANIEKQKNYDNLFVHVPIIVGIGIEITENQKNGGRVEIANVFDGSPAWHCGIRKHDVLLQVNSLSCMKQSKFSIQQIRQAIMGPRGTLVEILIQRERLFVLTVKRDIFGTPLPEAEALSSANPIFPTSLLFRKFSSDNNLVILLENEKIKPLPKDEKKPYETDAKQFCSLHFGELRSKTRGPVRILDKLNVAQQYRHTGTKYDEIQLKMKDHLEKELSAFVDLLLSKQVTSEDAEKWQNYDIFSEELLAHLPGTKEKMQQLKRKIDASSGSGLKASSVKPSPSITDEVNILQACHLIKTSSVIRAVEVIEDKICAYCKEMIESPELFQRYFEPDFRQEYTLWSLFWHFLHCLDPLQAIFQPRSWQSWILLESAFRKSVSSRIPGRPVPRCYDAFSDAAFTQSSSNSQDVVDAVEASFMILRQKPFWKTATLSDLFHDENFQDVLQRCFSALHHFFIDKKQVFDAYLNTMSRHVDWMVEKKADSAWMKNYYMIYKLQSATSDCLLKHSEDPSISWIVDSNGMLRDFRADLVPAASSERMHFPFVSTFVQLDQRIRDIFKACLQIVLARFHESDDCRSPSILNHEKVYKQLNDKYQIVKDFVNAFPSAIVEVASSNPQISRTTGGVLHDVKLHFQNVLSYFNSEQEKLKQILDGDAIMSQISRQMECYGKLMVYHNNLRSWHKNFEDTSVKELVFSLLAKMNEDTGKLLTKNLTKIGEGIQQKAIDTPFDDFIETQNVGAVCSLFRVLRCMASNLPLIINQRTTAETIIDHWFKKILGADRGSFRMKRISSQLTDGTKNDDPYVSLFSSELIEKHKAFENVQIIEYNAATSGVGIEFVLEYILTSPMPHHDSWKANILQHHDHYQKLFYGFVRSSILIINQRADWRSPLKSVLQRNRKKMDAPPVHKILEVLAVASAYWTVDIYAAGSLDDDADIQDILKELKKPHAAQIVTILRLLGLDKVVLPAEGKGLFGGAAHAFTGVVSGLFSAAPSEQTVVGTVKSFIEDNLDPHMVEVVTGQGKSVVLALTSIVLAFFGFRVDCACYSEYLSDRDRKEFKNVFDFFDVDKYILFSTFNTICERTINEAGDVRSAVCGLVGTGASFSSKAEQSDEPPRRKIALIDEVDVFFSRSFYGQEYIPVARVDHACVAELIRQVYELSRKPPSSKRLDEYTSADIEKHLPAYNDCKRVFRDWEFLIDHGVASMLCDVMQFEDPSKNPYQKVESTRMVGYQEGDQISYSQTRRYMTVFAWLKEHLNDPKSIDAPPASHMRLLVDCGHFGYEKIVRIGEQMHEYACILGVTGLLKPIMEVVDGKISEQRKILERFCLREASANRPQKSLQCTFVPTVYGLNSTGCLTFLASAKRSIWFVKSLEDFYLTIFREIEDCNHEQNKDLKISRAVLVVFETSKQLEDCADSRYLAPYKGVIQKLTPEMSDAMIKKNIIEQASFPGKVTFMTREFGRGTDFKGTNKDMNECGGVHVIQTFLSEELTEEKQIQGRTARQGQNGSYCLVLLCKSLEKYLCNFKYKDHPPESRKDASYEYFVGDMSTPGFLEIIPVLDAYIVLHAARQNFTKYFEKSVDSKGSDDYFHNQAMDFRQALAGAVHSPQPAQRADSLAKVKQFLQTMNGSVLPPPVIRPIKRTLVLLDATGSMGSAIDACERKIEEVCARAYQILEKAELDACFELQFAAFRNYDQDPPLLLSCSNWEKKPNSLKSFISSVRAFGGTHEEEAIEVALQYANSEHSRNPISQVLLIGDAPSNTKDQVAGGRSGRSRGCKLSPLTWKGTSMADQTFWEDECVKLRANGIPVYAFHVNNRPRVVENFKQISQKAGENGVCQFLDIASSQGDNFLCDLLSRRILDSLGSDEEEKQKLASIYGETFPPPRIMH